MNTQMKTKRQKQGEAISMSFGFDRIAPLLRRERLENETHFLRFHFLTRSNPLQTVSPSFVSSRPHSTRP
jgi:hypothetical protein